MDQVVKSQLFNASKTSVTSENGQGHFPQAKELMTSLNNTAGKKKVIMRFSKSPITAASSTNASKKLVPSYGGNERSSTEQMGALSQA